MKAGRSASWSSTSPSASRSSFARRSSSPRRRSPRSWRRSAAAPGIAARPPESSLLAAADHADVRHRLADQRHPRHRPARSGSGSRSRPGILVILAAIAGLIAKSLFGKVEVPDAGHGDRGAQGDQGDPGEDAVSGATGTGPTAPRPGAPGRSAVEIRRDIDLQQAPARRVGRRAALEGQRADRLAGADQRAPRAAHQGRRRRRLRGRHDRRLPRLPPPRLAGSVTCPGQPGVPSLRGRIG